MQLRELLTTEQLKLLGEQQNLSEEDLEDDNWEKPEMDDPIKLDKYEREQENKSTEVN